jgi:alcohol dehydrogenase class IV
LQIAELGPYDFLSPPKIAFGWGRRREAGSLAATLGRRALLIEGSRTLRQSGAIDEIVATLTAAGVETVAAAAVSHEPEVQDVDGAVALLRELHAGGGDFVLAVGGGSAIDLAKAAAALLTNDASPSVRDYLEGVGRGLQLSEPPLPVMAMPTTGGTGTEATKNAVISCFDPPFKKSLRSERMVPRVVLVDPELTASVPPATTAWTGMDAITQCIESYISRRARPVAQALAAEGLRRAVPALVEAVRDGRSRPAREAMSHAALMSGMALANSGLGMAHGVAAALGVHARVGHGLACAVMLPAALATNRAGCERLFAGLARHVWNEFWPSDAAAADALVERIDQLCQAVGVPRTLRELGVRREQIPMLARDSRGNSMDGNPLALSDDEILRLLEDLW